MQNVGKIMSKGGVGTAKTDKFAKSFSPLSEYSAEMMPGRKFDCSLDAGWTSLLVQTIEIPADVELFETAATPDLKISVTTKGEHKLEVFSGGSWKKAVRLPGYGGVTASGKIDRVRWHSKNSEAIQIRLICLPQYFLAAAADEYRRAGTAFRSDSLNELTFCDPVIFQTTIALSGAIKSGVPNLYAESAAQFLAVHLLSMNSGWSKSISAERNPGALTDRRLNRVLEFMEHHYMQELSLEQLSREAGISRFHFILLFKKSFGATPHQYLVRLRMRAAAALLESTDLGVMEIAARCGYANFANFSAAFRKYFACTPSEYRSKLYPNRLD